MQVSYFLDSFLVKIASDYCSSFVYYTIHIPDCNKKIFFRPTLFLFCCRLAALLQLNGFCWLYDVYAQSNSSFSCQHQLLALFQFFHLLIWLMMRLIMMRIRIGSALERWGMHLTCAEGFLSFCEVDSKLYFKVWDLLLYPTKKIFIILATSSKARDTLPWDNKDERAMSHGSLTHILYPGHDKCPHYVPMEFS